MKNLYLFIMLCLIVRIGYSQDVFMFYDRFDKKTQAILKDNDFKEMYILTVGNIDPKRSQLIEEEKVLKFLQNTFTLGGSYYLVIDWEEQLYKDLRRYKASNTLFKRAENEYIKLIKIIKDYNPNIKVGIYGFPTRLPVGRRALITENKFDKLLGYTDFISPSIYTLSPAKEIGENRNVLYFQENLKQAISYGSRLNKPVIPFIWEIVHPDNKSYGSTILSEKEFLSNISEVKRFKYSGISASGFIWWSPRKASKVYSEINGFNHKGRLKYSNDEFRDLYIRGISTKVKEVFVK